MRQVEAKQVTDYFTMTLYERVIGFMAIGGSSLFLVLIFWKLSRGRFWIETMWDESGKS